MVYYFHNICGLDSFYALIGFIMIHQYQIVGRLVQKTASGDISGKNTVINMKKGWP